MLAPSARGILGWVIAGALLVAGAVTIIVGGMTPVSFGWFAYQPLSNTTYAMGGDAFVLSRTTAAGVAVFTLGLLVLSFLAGRRLGRRQAAEPSAPDQ
ncbi:hypothetical protein [Microbacterium sp. P04]|uniref:hypothetical protein n=1 Tax=Microbacterium sp. P04 TaxID=3366947 RepID=UPI0037476A77